MTLKDMDVLEHKIGDIALWVVLALALGISIFALMG